MRLLVIAILAFLNIAGPASAQGEPRFALVIGNEAYSGFLTRLNNPKGGQPMQLFRQAAQGNPLPPAHARVPQQDARLTCRA
jgi:hypothetical protein